MKTIILLLVSSSFLFVSCSNKSAKFVGIWKSLATEHNWGGVDIDKEINIEKVGENFTVQIIQYPTQLGEKLTTDYGRKMVASYDKENDKLVLSGNGSTADLIYDPKSEYILLGGKEYQKSK